MPPYSFGQCGAIQPRSKSLRCQGFSSGGWIRPRRRHNERGTLAATQSRTSARKRRSSSVSPKKDWRCPRASELEGLRQIGDGVLVEFVAVVDDVVGVELLC